MLRGILGLAIVAALLTPLSAQDAAGNAADAFNQKFDQWVGLLERLRSIQAEYKVAKPELRTGLEQEFNTKLKEAQDLYPQMVSGAEAAYKAKPDDKRLTDFVMGMAMQAYEEGRYEEAIRLAELVIQHDPRNPEIYHLAGQAAFELTRLDLTEKYLTKAKEELTRQKKEFHGEAMLADLARERELWEVEKAARERDAKPAGDPLALPRVKLKTTKGDVIVELYENDAPNTVANFISLVEDGYYDGTPFHRVIANFMAQGGDPTGTGTGGPGYKIPCECYGPNPRMHFRGTLSMAHSGRDTGGSQFFLTFKPTRHLDNLHTAFGRVVEGMDVVDQFTRRTPDSPGAGEPDKIISATVLNKRDHEYKPRKVGDPEPKPAGDTPAGDKPADDKPAGDKPAATTPPAANDKPADDKQPATGDKPTDDKPAIDAPTGDKPAGDKPATDAKPPATDPPANADKPEPSDSPAKEDDK